MLQIALLGLDLLKTWKRVDVETPKAFDPVWRLMGATAITLKPIGVFYKNGYFTKCKKVHEDVHWNDIPHPAKLLIPWAVWYGTYIAESMIRWAGNKFRPYPGSEHSKEKAAYLAEWACDEGEE